MPFEFSSDDSGFLYIATGRRYIDEAAQSYESLLAVMPLARVCCFTDDVAYASRTFPFVKQIEEPFRNFLEKIPPLWRTPFDRTVFVDSDTIFAAPMLDLFDLLDRFDIAAAPDPFWVEVEGCPAAFQHLNTGLIAFRRTERVLTFIHTWFETYRSAFTADPKTNAHDQMSFQQLLYKSELRLYVLPVEYNLRLTCPQLIRIWSPARMLHARHADLRNLAVRLNLQSDYRFVLPNWTFFVRTAIFLISSKGDRYLHVFHELGKKIIRLVIRIRMLKNKP